jgi:hypothetical protein
MTQRIVGYDSTTTGGRSAAPFISRNPSLVDFVDDQTGLQGKKDYRKNFN